MAKNPTPLDLLKDGKHWAGWIIIITMIILLLLFWNIPMIVKFILIAVIVIGMDIINHQIGLQ